MAFSLFQIEPTTPGDLPALEAVHQAAFETDLEARLVRLLIDQGKAIVSLKATIANQIVGHILFTPAKVGPSGPEGPELPVDTPPPLQSPTLQPASTGLGLAPLAVLPQFQRQGIGAALVEAGLAACQQCAAPWVVVLGDPAYYSRFGFAPASRFGLECEFGGGDAFQIAILSSHRPPPRCGHVGYAKEFHEILAAHT